MKYEYKIYLSSNSSSEEREKELNRYGEYGFKIVDVQLKILSSISYQYIFTLMREIENTEDPQIDTRSFSDMGKYLMDRESGQ
jgi:hypothetical protein